jgi:hypothetical protein
MPGSGTRSILPASLPTTPAQPVAAVENDPSWKFVELPDGSRREMSKAEIANHSLLPDDSRVYSTISMKPREYRENQDFK